MRRRLPAQVPISFSKRGGARLGAGRPKKKDAGVSHGERPALAENQPVHVTLRVRPEVYNLRSQRCFEAIGEAMEASRGRFGFRCVGFSVQGNHLHLMGEAASTEALTLGLQGLKVRIAKGLNRVMGRRGKVFSERYHLRVLDKPAEARAAMEYIANNTAKHAAQYGRHLPSGYRDPYTVGHFGDRVLLPPGTASMVVEPASWLLREGWRRGASAKPAIVPCPTIARSRSTPTMHRRPAPPAPLSLFDLESFGQGSCPEATRLLVNGTVPTGRVYLESGAGPDVPAQSFAPSTDHARAA